MAAFKEEILVPLAAMIKAKDINHAFALSEQSRYGLGVTICTWDIDKAVKFANQG